VKGDSQNLQALNGLGTCFFLLADYAASETYLKKALSVNAGDVQTKLNLALLYSQTNRRADAVRLYREVAESPTAPADWKKEAAARLAELE
jgi:tetratricopeptide (TPR) repeat protein